MTRSEFIDACAAQVIDLDFGDETPYAFGRLPENRRLNGEMYERAIERASVAVVADQTGLSEKLRKD